MKTTPLHFNVYRFWKRQKFQKIVLFLAAVVILFSCATPHQTKRQHDVQQHVEKILILPFQNLYEVYGDNVSLKCPFCHRSHVIGTVEESADQFLTEHLINYLRGDSAYQLILPGEAEHIISSLEAERNEIAMASDLIIETGGRVGADAVLIGYLFCFKERVGTRYSVERPASVSFSLYLVRVSNRQIIWSGTFEETQQSLSENLLKIVTFFKRKASWITAREMAAEGLESILRTFPKP